MYHKYGKMPIAFLRDNDTVGVFLDNKIRKEVIKVIKHLLNNKIEFICLSPVFQSPKKVEDDEFNAVNIKNYLHAYSIEGFYDGFIKIGFDLPQNLIKYCREYDCFHLVKPIFDNVKKHVQSGYKDWRSNQMIMVVKREDIRDSFNSMYRDMQLSIII